LQVAGNEDRFYPKKHWAREGYEGIINNGIARCEKIDVPRFEYFGRRNNVLIPHAHETLKSSLSSHRHRQNPANFDI
jgi:hypothetical protein